MRLSTRPKRRYVTHFRHAEICVDPGCSHSVTSCTRRFRIWMEPFPRLPKKTAAFKLPSRKPRRVSMSSTRTKRGGKRSLPNGSSLPTTSVLSYANLKRRSESSRNDITTRYGSHYTYSQAFGAHRFLRPLLSTPSVKRSMITSNTSNHEYRFYHKLEKMTTPHGLHGDHGTKLTMMQSRS